MGAAVVLTAAVSQAQTPAEIEAAIKAAHSKYASLQEGANADYIPALAKVDPKIYGIAVVTTDGKVYTAGDIKSEVSIQSISKVFTMAKVMQEQGVDAIENNMGVDATGQVFNSIDAVEQYKGAEMNAMVNPGAITATSMVKGANREEIWNKILSYYGDFAGRPLKVNQEVFKSEADTNQRNQAIAMLMYAYGHIKEEPLRACDIYTEQCSVNVNAKDLATMAATLANGGKNPVTGKVVLDATVRARSAGGDGHGWSLRRHGQVALQDRAPRQERGRRRHHRRLPRQVRDRGRSRRRSTRRETASRARRRSPTSRTHSAAIPTRPSRK